MQNIIVNLEFIFGLQYIIHMNLEKLAQEIINGKRLCREDDLSFFKTEDLQTLCDAADLIRGKLCGDQIELCSIINAKSGKCSENCKFCAQSAMNHTNCKTYSFCNESEIISEAQKNQNAGIHRFSLVTSGKALTGEEFENALRIYKKMHETLKIKLCASMGFLSNEQLSALKDCGVTCYHHNIETSERNFKNICTTHTYQMKIDTLKQVKKTGLRICSGGIIGMGETFEDRLEMALALSEIQADSIPINTLMPVKGTPFENLQQLSEEEILRTIAMFRFINPTAQIRLAAGRKLMKNYGEKAFKSGANATITGNMLTTTGSTVEEDIKLIQKLGRIL